MNRLVALTACCIALCLAMERPSAQAPDPALVVASDLSYAGAFRLPAGTDDQHTSAYGGTALAYYPAHDSLFFVGHDWHQRVAEVSIPEVRANVGSVNQLATARILQPFTDVLQGHIHDIGNGTAKIGGLLPLGDRLVVSAYLYYDGAGEQTRSHFVTGLDFSQLPAVQGPFVVDRDRRQAGTVSGYMTAVPDAWRALLKAPYLTGQCCLAVVGRTSEGPAITAFDPADLGAAKPAVRAGAVLGYPEAHPTLGAWDSSHTLYNGAATVNGVAFPADSRSVLFIGRRATGGFCYGSGNADEALKGQPTGSGDRYCYDPVDHGKGVHSYPYENFIWAYDVRDLAAVRDGKRDPWAVKPYATWNFDVPFQNGARQIVGASYDQTGHRLFITAAFEDGDRPLVHVFTLRARH